MTHDLVVAQPRQTPLALPGLLAVEHASVPVGGTARLLVHSGLPGQRMTLEIWRGGRRTEVRHLVSGRSADVLELPIADKDRGGFGVTLTLVRDHQIVQQAAEVSVPWQDRTLDVAFSTFRDRLRPGDRETWRVTVKSTGPQREATAVGGGAGLDVRPLARPVRAARARERAVDLSLPDHGGMGASEPRSRPGRLVGRIVRPGGRFRRSAAGSPGLLERLRHRRTGTAADVPGNRRRRDRRRRGWHVRSRSRGHGGHERRRPGNAGSDDVEGKQGDRPLASVATKQRPHRPRPPCRCAATSARPRSGSRSS